MNPERFRDSPAGRVFRTPPGYWTFIPKPLPPVLPWTVDLATLLSEADFAYYSDDRFREDTVGGIAVIRLSRRTLGTGFGRRRSSVGW